MAELTPEHMATELLANGFERKGPSATALSDPIADTPMVVTLDQLRPYDHDPRLKRNRAYDDIKASIRERGLDAPPAITRRPGDEHFIVRNGGNTRLAILRELWAETKEERFFRIACQFRPWPERGEIVALTGHLAENELRGGLTFIERALGVEKAREFYEQESGEALSQSELARRLKADGYPLPQSHISRMLDAVHFLLPAIPNLLYGGLGRHQVERLAVMRNACERVWAGHATARDALTDFQSFFQDTLAQFDAAPEAFSAERALDELIGQMAEILDVDYDTLSLELSESENRQRVLSSEPAPGTSTPSTTTPPHGTEQSRAAPGQSNQPPRQQPTTLIPQDGGAEPAVAGNDDVALAPADSRLQNHIVSQAPTTERLRAIQQLMAEQMGDEAPAEFDARVLQAIPVQAGGLYPISDVWYIEPSLDEPERLRLHITQFAREIADEAAIDDHIEPIDDGIGFSCVTLPDERLQALPPFARTALALLVSLSGEDATTKGLDPGLLSDHLANLLFGRGNPDQRLSDTALVKLFRLLRLARRLFDLEADRVD
ncbi:ParB family protein [Marinobacterium rhizophilum]|uniref:ParB family protein n=1 Tax=Marinobacterium rhizophilum TaxID=420402 RepID=A0ABY5HKK4_9GAMM|nr:ParB family protein [Marinobacterium rhizophilum]UTW12401.1 ParB family protein [Marinobacterium rhizophilum]